MNKTELYNAIGRTIPSNNTECMMRQLIASMIQDEADQNPAHDSDWGKAAFAVRETLTDIQRSLFTRHMDHKEDSLYKASYDFASDLKMEFDGARAIAMTRLEKKNHAFWISTEGIELRAELAEKRNSNS